MNLSKLSFFTIKLFSLIVLLRITHYIFFYIFTGFVTYCSQIEPQISVLRRKERKVDGSGFLTSSISCIPTPSILWTYFKILFKNLFCLKWCLSRDHVKFYHNRLLHEFQHMRVDTWFYFNHTGASGSSTCMDTYTHPNPFFFKFLSGKFLGNDWILCQLTRISIDTIIQNCWYTCIFRRLEFCAYLFSETCLKINDNMNQSNDEVDRESSHFQKYLGKNFEKEKVGMKQIWRFRCF